MLQTKKPAKKAESTVIKPMAKKDRFKNLGGEIGKPPFPKGRKGMPYVPTTQGGAKNGKTMSKYKAGGSLGMKSVKAGYDNNPSITRADIITAAKGKAKSGTTMKKAQYGGKAASMAPKAKNGMHMMNGKMMKDSEMKMGGSMMKMGGKMMKKKCDSCK